MIGRLKIGSKVPSAIYTDADAPVFIVDSMGEIQGKADQAVARRLVACWNLLEGFTTEHIEAGQVDLSALVAQRDQLMAALREALPVVENLQDLIAKKHPGFELRQTAIVRAALEGGAA